MLATVDDVKRVLKLTTTTPEQDQVLQEWLATAESRLRPVLMDFDDSAGTTTFYNVAAPGRLQLPVAGVTIDAVRTYVDVAGSAYAVPANEYTPQDLWVELEYPGDYQKVEVDWTYAGGVPEAVRDGVAMYAAYLASTSQAGATGIKSERIGDYSYTISDVKTTRTGIPLDAWQLLKPFRKPRRVLTTP